MRLKFLNILIKILCYKSICWRKLQPKYINLNRMEPELNQRAVILKLTQRIGDFPATVVQIQQAVRSGRKTDPMLGSLKQQTILQMMINSNIKMIECQFLDMMQQVLKKIQPEIQHYPEHKSIKYLESIIYEHLDPKIFSAVRISKIRIKLIGDSLQQKNMAITDRLFTELITVMNELLQIMKQYYGLTRDNNFSGILFQCISVFISDNQNCFLVKQDKQTQSQIKAGKKKDVPIQALDKIQADGKEKDQKLSYKALQIAQNLIGSLYSQIKQVNPFGSRKLDEKQVEQKKAILKKVQNAKKRQRLNQDTIKIVQRLLSMTLGQLVQTMNSQQKVQFSSVLFDSLQQLQKLKSNQKKVGSTKIIESQIVGMLQAAVDCDGTMSDEEFKEHKHLKWITLFFKAIEKQYHNDSERRKWLVKFCENQRISKKLDNPYSVIKILESQKMQENNIIKSLRSLPVSIKQLENKKIVKAQIQDEAHLALEHQLNRIRLYQLKKKYQKQPQLQFERLTNSKTRVITFLFSGFLSEDTCKVDEWSGLLSNFYDSQVYSVRWQSKTVAHMMEFAFKSITDLGPSQSIAMLGGPYVKAIAILHHLYQRYQENPFNPAFQAAKMTGQFMGQFIAHNFKGYFINLVGFSLGTQVIKNIMAKLAQKNCLNMLHKVYLMGGVADITEIQNLIEYSPSPLTIINLHSDNDYILKYLLRLCKFGIKPVGLNPIKQFEGHTVKNEDCTYYVEGHMAYRTNLQFFSKWLKIADD